MLGSGQTKGDPHFSVREMPRRDDSTGAGQHHNVATRPSGTEVLESQLGKVAAGVLHHLEQIWTCLLGGDAVDLAHLSSGDPGHLDARVRDETEL